MGEALRYSAGEIIDRFSRIDPEKRSTAHQQMLHAAFSFDILRETSPELVSSYVKSGGRILFYNFDHAFGEGYEDSMAVYWPDCTKDDLSEHKARQPHMLSELKVGSITVNTVNRFEELIQNELEPKTRPAFLEVDKGDPSFYENTLTHEIVHFVDELTEKYTGLWQSSMPVFKTIMRYEDIFSAGQSLTSQYEQSNKQAPNGQNDVAYTRREVFAQMGEAYYWPGDREVAPITYLYFEKIVGYQLEIMSSNMPDEIKQIRMQVLSETLADKHFVNRMMGDENTEVLNSMLGRASREPLPSREELTQMYRRAEAILSEFMDRVVEYARENSFQAVRDGGHEVSWADFAKRAHNSSTMTCPD